jgi:LysR family transcriptional regulator (chromosome initiation inhibitor)
LLAGWGVSVVPELLVRERLHRGALVDVAPGHTLPVQLFWHCWNLESAVLDALTRALTAAAAQALA